MCFSHLGVFLISVNHWPPKIPKIKRHRKFVKLQYTGFHENPHVNDHALYSTCITTPQPKHFLYQWAVSKKHSVHPPCKEAHVGWVRGQPQHTRNQMCSAILSDSIIDFCLATHAGGWSCEWWSMWTWWESVVDSCGTWVLGTLRIYHVLHQNPPLHRYHQKDWQKQRIPPDGSFPEAAKERKYANYSCHTQLHTQKGNSHARTHMHTRTHAPTCTHARTHPHAHTRTHAHTHTHTHTHTRTHARTHTHTHACES